MNNHLYPQAHELLILNLLISDLYTTGSHTVDVEHINRRLYCTYNYLSEYNHDVKNCNIFTTECGTIGVRIS